jgi:hypothetical protein
MWEAYQLTNEDLLWASQGLYGGIAGEQQATCGAVSSSAVCLGLRLRQPLAAEEAVKKARLDVEKEASSLAKAFRREFGTMTCIDLVRVDFSAPGERDRFKAQNLSKDTCDRYITFVLKNLYELEEKREAAK